MKRVRALCVRAAQLVSGEMLEQASSAPRVRPCFHPAAAGLQGTCLMSLRVRSPAAGSSQKPSHLACHAAPLGQAHSAVFEPFCGDWVRMDTRYLDTEPSVGRLWCSFGESWEPWDKALKPS